MPVLKSGEGSNKKEEAMCVAYPGKVVEIEGKTASVDFNGNIANVKIGLVDVKVGAYVLAHAGMAIEVMDEEKALSIIKIREQLEEQ